ncbi:hypothetical protein [Propioniciclava soli]|uniref:hypothetical protein n=1 Tax=Propioniciclava soli TaxID=2775081 RepID=UPI001E2ADD20|nr:hypothetical protein [Propioniciclava soli]
MQQQRRHNPYPTTWEIPAGITIAAAAVLLYGVHLGRALATLLAGHGWHWPAPTELVTSIPAVLAGNPHAGLPVGALPPAASAPVLACVIALEVVLLAGIIATTAWGWGRWGPGRMLGMATPAQVENVLGVSRLRKVRHIIRPDLYPKKRDHR